MQDLDLNVLLSAILIGVVPAAISYYIWRKGRDLDKRQQEIITTANAWEERDSIRSETIEDLRKELANRRREIQEQNREIQEQNRHIEQLDEDVRRLRIELDRERRARRRLERYLERYGNGEPPLESLD